MPAPRAVSLSLVSHTNAGKTTLARTLLRRDVGQVQDGAHVTEEAEAHVLIATAEAELRLWDTPGFGDSARLLARLRHEARPLLWLAQQVWDRLTDRPFWCSQRAALNVRDQADAVLYLVNAAEPPDEAGYLAPELDLLAWIGKPVLVLLNQTGEAGQPAEEMAQRQDLWRRYLRPWPVVQDVLSLDAFSRCWVQESRLLGRVADLLPEALKGDLLELKATWDRRNLEVFDGALSAMAAYLAAAACDREPFAGPKLRGAERRRGMRALGQRLQAATRDLTATLLDAHGLTGEAAADIERRLDAFVVQGEEHMAPERGALLGSVASGALGGLAADIFSGGLSFGGGLVAGAILGALGGAGLAQGYRMLAGTTQPAVAWSPTFLERLTMRTLLRYLAIAHFGRGRGTFREWEQPERWRRAVEDALQAEANARQELWKRAARPESDTAKLTPPLHVWLEQATRGVLAEAYPEATELLRSATHAPGKRVTIREPLQQRPQEAP